MQTAAPVQEGDELEALFESISSTRQQEVALQHAAAAVTATATATATAAAQAQQSDLQQEALPASDTAPKQPVKSHPGLDAGVMYERIGNLTRQLHTAIRELGYDKALEKAAIDIPDARDRLSYVSRLTGQAAERTLSAVEAGQNEQQALNDQAGGLAQSWEKFFGAQMGLDEFKALAQDTRLFLAQAQSRSAATQHQLTEIMMAQDFHDLTGQVINKLTVLSERIENELIKFLVDVLPNERRQELNDELEGPVVNTAGRADVVTSQTQVDDLLESLGF